MSKAQVADYKVTEFYLRTWLASLRRISGPQYAFLLEKSGLSKFTDHYPSNNLNIAATGVEIMKLSQAIYEFLGKDAFNLFTMNLGREFARTTGTSPILRKNAESISPVNSEVKLIQLLEFVIDLDRQVINEHIKIKTTDQPNTVEIVYENCAYCAGLPRIGRSMCIGLVAFWSQISQELTKRRYRVEETRCAAMHDESDCHFLIHY